MNEKLHATTNKCNATTMTYAPTGSRYSLFEKLEAISINEFNSIQCNVVNPIR